MPPTPAAQLKSFLAKYTPAMQAEMKAAHAKMRKFVPGAVEMVYDSWNGLVVGFGPDAAVRNALVIKSVSARQRSRRPSK